jgi:nucleoid-associated protein YgaU
MQNSQNSSTGANANAQPTETGTSAIDPTTGVPYADEIGYGGLSGSPGQAGPAGPAGPTGPTGKTGGTGKTGKTGKTGATGKTGGTSKPPAKKSTGNPDPTGKNNPNHPVSGGTSPTKSTPSKTTYYTVKSGNSLSQIAKEFNVPGGWQALYNLNKTAIGGNPNLIHPGMRLKL